MNEHTLLDLGVPTACFQGELPYCSRLTNRGVPFEVAFVWPGHQVRCTVDINMHASQQDRFTESLAQVPGVHHPILDSIAGGLQTDPAAFRYGAWLGYRPERSCPKLYAELTAAQRGYLPDPAAILQRRIQPVMFGWQQDSGQYEVYYKAAYLYPADLRTLLSFFGLPDRSKQLRQQCERLLKRTINTIFPLPDIGFSVAFSAEGVAQVFTLYAFAQSSLGVDYQIREAILSLGKEERWYMDQYADLSQPLTVPDYDINTFHGMIGFTCGQHDGIHFTVGLSPFIHVAG